MKHIPYLILPMLFLALFSAATGSALAADKVTICHVPPGNPDNAHTITVGSSAVPAHLAHGDSEGACDGGGSSGSEAASGPSYVVCDGREGETGRMVSVSLVGRVHTEHVDCD